VVGLFEALGRVARPTSWSWKAPTPTAIPPSA